MPLGLSRSEQYALLGLVALILIGLQARQWRHEDGGQMRLVPGQGRWESLGHIDADGRMTLDLDRAATPGDQDFVIDLNRAGQIELERLPQVGPSRARSIIELREELGGFGSIEQLEQVRGIGPATLERVRPHLRIDADLAPASDPSAAEDAGGRVNINTADAAQLQKISGVGEVIAGRIIEHRRLHGPFTEIDQLRQVRGIGPVNIERMRPQVRVE